jgi:hypothetical protein
MNFVESLSDLLGMMVTRLADTYVRIASYSAGEVSRTFRSGHRCISSRVSGFITCLEFRDYHGGANNSLRIFFQDVATVII